MALDDFLMSMAGIPTSPTAPPTVADPAKGNPTPAPTDANTPAASAQPAADTPSPPPAMAAAKDPDTPTHLSQVKGPFGTHGALGSILGTIEDALLVNAGLRPVYQPAVQTAKQADAISGWDTDPAGAYIKLAAVAGVPAADAHLTSMVDGAYKRQQIASNQQTMAQNAASAPVKLALDQFKLQAPYMSQAAHVTDDATAQKFGPMVRAAFARNHLDASELPTEDTAAAWKAWSLKGVPTGTLYSTDNLQDYRGQRLKQIQQSVDQQGENIDSQINYRGTMAGVAQQNAGTAARNAGTNAQNAQTNASRAAETARHNQVTEKQGADRVNQGQQRIDAKNAPPPPSFEGQTATNKKTGQTFKAVKVNGQLHWQ